MEKFSVKTDFWKIIFESPHQPKFCNFLLDFGHQNRAKNHKIWVGKDFQKWFFQKSDFTENVLSNYNERFKNSWAYKELYKARNFHQGFEHGLLPGVFNAGLQMITGGRGWKDPLGSRAGHEQMRSIMDYYGQKTVSPAGIEVDGEILG